MNTIAQIEKRRRELRRINYFLIYLLAMAIFGLFFFVDEFTGFFGSLKYNIFLRFYFVGFVVAFLFYLAQKEKQQSKLTGELIAEMQETSTQLAKELRHKEFLREISVLLSNLRDSAVLEQLFSSALTFFQADGGAVVLRDKTGGWKAPLVVYPEETDENVINQITGLISHAGRSFLQPDPDCPEHSPVKGVRNAFGVPLRLEGRLFGVIAFWSDNSTAHDRSDLGVLEVIGREAANSRFTIELLQEKSDQFNGLLALLAKASDGGRSRKSQTVKVAEQAKALAREMGLPRATVEAVEIAAMLRDVDKLVKAPGGKTNGSSRSPQVLKTFNFPARVTEILAGVVEENGNGKKRGAAKKTPIGSHIIKVADSFVAQTKPPRGRGQSPETVISKLETDAGSAYDATVLGALKQMIVTTNDMFVLED